MIPSSLGDRARGKRDQQPEEHYPVFRVVRVGKTHNPEGEHTRQHRHREVNDEVAGPIGGRHHAGNDLLLLGTSMPLRDYEMNGVV